MRQVWLTARYEARTTLGRRAFWITTFILPAVVVLVAVLVQVLSSGNAGALQTLGSGAQPIGYVDEGGLLTTPPTGLPPGLAVSYPDEQSAKAALSRGVIDRYYLIPADYVASGRLTVVQPQYQPLRALSGSDLIHYVINTGLTGEAQLARLLLDPTPAQQTADLAPASTAVATSATASYLLPYLLMFILYLALAMTSGFMLQSVSREKENRTAEMLLVSVRPRQLMLGKIAGLSVVGLLQVAIWMAVFFGTLGLKGNWAGVDVHLSGQVAARVVPWAVGYFLLGYLLYSSLYATLGVLAPTQRDATHFVYLAIIPLIVPLLFNRTFGAAPNGALAVVLSLFPLTSPVSMVARLGAAPVAWWQAAAGLVVLAMFTYAVVLLAGRLFRAENVLSTAALNWQRLRGAFRPEGVSQRGAAAQPRGRAQAEETARAGEASRAEVAAQPGDAARPGDGAASRGAPRGLAQAPTPDAQKAERDRQRLYLSVVVACLVVVVGVVEFARGDQAGVPIAVLGVAIGFVAYRRMHRR
jgi:ABC-2 type transport system permease protein